MRCSNADRAAGFRYAMKLGDKGHDIGNMLSDMTTGDLIEFVVGKWIRRDPEIVNYVSVRLRIGIDANRTGRLVPAASDIENFFRRCEFAGGYLSHGS